MIRFDIDKFNSILEKYNQSLRAIHISTKLVRLSNGLLLVSESDIRKCKRRVMRESKEYCSRFDLLYSLSENERLIAEKEAKAVGSRRGGINCQALHGDKIAKNNLTHRSGNFKKGREPWNKGKTKETCNKVKKLLSEARKGDKNPMYGVTHSTEYKAQQSVKMKELIESGQFTPNSNNRNTHWDSYYEGRPFRSSWEAIYQSLDPQAEYEALRIRYSYQGSEYIYIVDFINHYTKTVVEVKPLELCNEPKTVAKLTELKSWAKNNGYKFLLVDKDYIIRHRDNIKLSDFDEKTQKKIKGLTCETN